MTFGLHHFTSTFYLEAERGIGWKGGWMHTGDSYLETLDVRTLLH